MHHLPASNLSNLYLDESGCAPFPPAFQRVDEGRSRPVVLAAFRSRMRPGVPARKEQHLFVVVIDPLFAPGFRSWAFFVPSEQTDAMPEICVRAVRSLLLLPCELR